MFAGDSEVDQLAIIRAGTSGECLTDALPGPGGRIVDRFAPLLPPEGLDFLVSLLSLDPTHRPTARECLSHAFFAGLDKRYVLCGEDDPARVASDLQQPSSDAEILQNAGDMLLTTDDDMSVGPAVALDGSDRFESPGIDDIVPLRSSIAPPLIDSPSIGTTAFTDGSFGVDTLGVDAPVPDDSARLDAVPAAQEAARDARASDAGVPTPSATRHVVAASTPLAPLVSEAVTAAISRPWVGSRQARVERQRRGGGWQNRRVVAAVAGGAGTWHGGGGGGHGHAAAAINHSGATRPAVGGGHPEATAGVAIRRWSGAGSSGMGGSLAGGAGPAAMSWSSRVGARPASPSHVSLVPLGIDHSQPPSQQQQHQQQQGRTNSRTGSRGRGPGGQAATSGLVQQPGLRSVGAVPSRPVPASPVAASSHAESKVADWPDEHAASPRDEGKQQDDEVAGAAAVLKGTRRPDDLHAAGYPCGVSRARALGLQEGTVYASALSSFLAGGEEDTPQGVTGEHVAGNLAPPEPASPHGGATVRLQSGRAAGSSGHERTTSGGLVLGPGLAPRRTSFDDLSVPAGASMSSIVGIVGGAGRRGSGGRLSGLGSLCGPAADGDPADANGGVTLHAVGGGVYGASHRGRRSHSPTMRSRRHRDGLGAVPEGAAYAAVPRSSDDPPDNGDAVLRGGSRATAGTTAVGRIGSTAAGPPSLANLQPQQSAALRRAVSPAAPLTRTGAAPQVSPPHVSTAVPPLAGSRVGRAQSRGGRELSPSPGGPSTALSSGSRSGGGGHSGGRELSPSFAATGRTAFGGARSGSRRGHSRSGRTADVSPPPSREATGDRTRTPSRSRHFEPTAGAP